TDDRVLGGPAHCRAPTLSFSSVRLASRLPEDIKSGTCGTSPRVLRESQCVVEMWVVEDAPELIYCLVISPRLIGNHALDLPQGKRGKCVAAALQRRSYRLGTDEFAESHHRRGVSQVVRGGKFCRSKSCATLMASTIVRSELM